MHLICKWMNNNGLALAVQKTEAVLIPYRIIFRPPNHVPGGNGVPLKRPVKYLLDNRLSYSQQIKTAAEKTMTTAHALGRIMPNIREPRESKRPFLNSVILSKLLFVQRLFVQCQTHQQEYWCAYRGRKTKDLYPDQRNRRPTSKSAYKEKKRTGR